MKKISGLITLVTMIISCGTPKPNRTGTGSNAMKTGSSESEEIAVVGTEYVPILGKNEAGIRADLEGTWILESTPGVSLAYTPTMPPKPETRNDTTTRTEIENGVTVTTSDIKMTKPQEARITPPQNSNPNMHVPEAPRLRFFGSNETVSGFTGCNKFSGRFTQTGTNSISFQGTNPSTKMACIGSYDENAFMNALHRVNAFKSNNGNLQLMEGDNVLFIFSRR